MERAYRLVLVAACHGGGLCGVTLVLLALGMLLTFPPVFEAFE